MTRTLVCNCSSENVGNFTAVLRLTPAIARDILAKRDLFLETKAKHPTLSWLVFDNLEVEFYNGCEDSDEAWLEWTEEEPEDELVPARTDFEHLKISEHYICWEFGPKHVDGTLETFEVGLELLQAVAASASESASAAAGPPCTD